MDGYWRFVYYGKEEKDHENFIKGGDIIMLRHCETDSYLAADIAYLK